MGWILAALFLFIAICNLGIAIGWLAHGKRGSLVPCLGGMAGVAACFALPFPGLRHWYYIPLLADLGTGYLTIAVAFFTIRQIYKKVIRGDFD